MCFILPPSFVGIGRWDFTPTLGLPFPVPFSLGAPNQIFNGSDGLAAQDLLDLGVSLSSAFELCPEHFVLVFFSELVEEALRVVYGGGHTGDLVAGEPLT